MFRKNFLDLSKKQQTRRLYTAVTTSLRTVIKSNVKKIDKNNAPRNDIEINELGPIQNNTFEVENLAIDNLSCNHENPNAANLNDNFNGNQAGHFNVVNDLANNLNDDSHSDVDSLDNDSDNEEYTDEEGNVGFHNSDSEEDVADREELKDFLCSWSIKYQIRQTALTDLLKGLKQFNHPELPSDARTLLKTPKNIEITPLGSGSYAHYGFEKALMEQLECFIDKPVPDTFFLSMNIDGLPLSKSSQSQVWPILMKIVDKDIGVCEPFVVGIFHGSGKPLDVHAFLEPTITEYIKLRDAGFIYKNKLHKVKIKFFTADTVARNYVLLFPPHNSRCGKCIQEGETIMHRQVFLDNCSPLRNDENFRVGVPEKYSNLVSPLEGIISLTKQVPLDPMHLLDEGVIKKHLKLLINLCCGNNENQIKKLNKEYIAFKEWVPKDFVRKTRSISQVDHFKATELRLAGLYTGIILFQEHVPSQFIYHFNILNCALRILHDSNLCIQNNACAKELLVYYVDLMKLLYGKHHIIFNVHNLIHLCDDVLEFGQLDMFSVIAFENHLQYIKKLVRKGSYVLQQIMNRLNEKSKIRTVKKNNITNYPVLKRFFNDKLPEGYHGSHKLVQFQNLELTNIKPDNCCYLNDETIIIINKICYHDDTAVVLGQKFTNCSSLENYPIDSRLLGINKSNQLCEEIEEWPIGSIMRKGFVILSNENFYIFPLLHTYTQ